MLIPLNFLSLSLAGLCLSLYALFVEFHPLLYPEDTSFVPLCDIDTSIIRASCSDVFSMPEGHLLSFWGLASPGSTLDVPNACLGVAFYAAMALHYLLEVSGPVRRRGGGGLGKKVARIMSVAAAASSAWLVTVLVRRRELCVLCFATHTINFTMLYRLWGSDKVVDANNKYVRANKKLN